MKIFSTLALVCLTASAAAADPPVIKDGYAFDVMHPKAKCAKVTGALLAKLDKSYACAAATTESASGKPLVAECPLKKGDSSRYLVLRSAKDCNEERETQLANGG